jgi:cation:H+ antiporter
MNILILAILDFSYPSTFRRTVFSPQNIHHSLSAMITLVLTSLVGLGIATRIDISFYHVSLITWSILIVYFYGVRLLFIERVAPEEIAVSEPPQKELLHKGKELSFAFLGLTASALVILFSSPYLVDASDELARLSGLGHIFIGTTLVALATSLPELVATFAAFRMGSPDLAIGNIFGSNSFNMLTFVPLDFLYPKVLFHEVNSSHLVTVFGVLLATGTAVMGQLYRKKERSRFTEPSSETVVVVIGLILYLLFLVKGDHP